MENLHNVNTMSRIKWQPATTVIDFSTLQSTWQAAFVLVDYISKNAGLFDGKTILELGLPTRNQHICK